jgi:hypothetical protein
VFGRSVAKMHRELLCPVLQKVFGDIDCISPEVYLYFQAVVA